MSNLPAELTIILGIIAIISLLLYLREYFFRKKEYKDLQKISVETKQKSAQLLAAAQLTETEVISAGNYTTQKLINEFKAELENIIAKGEKSIELSQNQLNAFLQDLEKRSVALEDTYRRSVEKKTAELFEKLETQLSDFLVATGQKTTSAIELELKSTRELIETYKARQLKLIDENVVAMMEQTLNLVLGRKLSLKDQLDLVYESLEKAKVEKFVV